jgi:hypothetical protein
MPTGPIEVGGGFKPATPWPFGEEALAIADEAWDPAEHPRGQPQNAGEFVAGAGGAALPPGGVAHPAHRMAKAVKALKARSLFAQRLDALPRRARTSFKSWADVAAAAPNAHNELVDKLGHVAKALNLKTDAKSPETLTPAQVKNDSGYLFIAPDKSQDRAAEKVRHDLQGDWSRLTDVVRASIAVKSVSQLRAAVAAVEAEGMVLAQKPKDRFVTPGPTGYRDLNTVVRLPSGALAEVQYHLKSIISAKEKEGHPLYIEMTELERKNASWTPTENWPEEDAQKYRALVAKQRAIYDKALEDGGD